MGTRNEGSASARVSSEVCARLKRIPFCRACAREWWTASLVSTGGAACVRVRDGLRVREGKGGVCVRVGGVSASNG